MNWNEYKSETQEMSHELALDIQEAEKAAAIVSEIIRQRNALGISQRDLAKRCGMPQSSVARIESQKIMPRLDTLIKLLNQLDLSLTVSRI